jgi:hypothetical protein
MDSFFPPDPDAVHDFPLVPHLCAPCGAEIIGALSASPRREPRDGDILLCSECGKLSRYRTDGAAERLTAEEEFIWMQDFDLAAVQQWIRWARWFGLPE